MAFRRCCVRLTYLDPAPLLVANDYSEKWGASSPFRGHLDQRRWWIASQGLHIRDATDVYAERLTTLEIIDREWRGIVHALFQIS